MSEMFDEYGGLLIALVGTLSVLGLATKILFSGGILWETLSRLGNMAC